MNPFKFIKSMIAGAGTGTADYGVVQQMNLTPASFYGPRHNVQRQLNPQAPAMVKIGQYIVPVSILGDSGLSVSGALQLTPLAKEKGN